MNIEETMHPDNGITTETERRPKRQVKEMKMEEWVV